MSHDWVYVRLSPHHLSGASTDGAHALRLAEGVLSTTDTDDYTTLAGYVIFQLGRIPAAGDALVAEGWRLEVVDMDGRRIDKVLATRLPGRALTGTA